MTVIEASSLLDAAIAFARRGWPVFPCSHRNKRPLLPKDKDAEGNAIKGTGGLKKASTDEEQIRAWWRKWPKAMIGVPVGDAGMLVVDFDPRIDDETGEEWTLEGLKADLEAQMGCALNASLAVRTPSGGVHVYFRMPEDAPIGNRGNLPDHIDVRGAGGYTIVPPSVCEGDDKNAAGRYRWLRGDAEAPIADMPEQLVAILRAPAAAPEVPPAPFAGERHFPVDVDERHRRYALNALDQEMAELAATPEGGGRWGGRNAGIYHAALKLGGLVGAGAIAEAVVRASLESVIRAMPNNRDLSGALQTLSNGLENGIARPRDLSGVGQMTRGGRSRRAADPSGGYAPFADPSAYADEAGAPDPDVGGEDFPPFHSGSDASDAPSSGDGGRIAPAADPEMDRKAAFLPMTDLGNAERFRLRHGNRFRFCAELGWFVWDGRRWELLSEEKDKVPGMVSLAVFETVRAIRNEADLIERSGLREDHSGEGAEGPETAALDFIVGWKGRGDDKVPILFSQVLRDHAKSSEGASRIGCIAGLAKSFGDIAIRADAMDRDRMAINVMNGTLRVVTSGKRWAPIDGELKEISVGKRPGVRLFKHNPTDLISKVAHVTFKTEAKAPIYDQFLLTVQPDEATRRFLHQWGGLSLTGDIGCQKLVFHHGGGRNGKSTLNDLWGTIAGDYGATIAIETFLDQGRGRKGGEATPDLARLPGVRFLRTSEPEKGAKLAEALIKLITGGEPIDARHLNKGFFTFLPSFKLSVQGNHKPKITGHDDGIWRRVLLVPWSVQIAKDDVDADLPVKLRKEASGVLNRLLAGLIDWQEHGLIEPESVSAATAKYREQSDQLGRFLADCTRPLEGARSKSSTLFALHNAWAKATGAAEWQQVGFTKAMEDRGFDKKASNGMQWLDIEMIKAVEDFTEDSGRARGGGTHDDPGPYDGDYPL